MKLIKYTYHSNEQINQLTIQLLLLLLFICLNYILDDLPSFSSLVLVIITILSTKIYWVNKLKRIQFIKVKFIYLVALPFIPIILEIIIQELSILLNIQDDFSKGNFLNLFIDRSLITITIYTVIEEISIRGIINQKMRIKYGYLLGAIITGIIWGSIKTITVLNSQISVEDILLNSIIIILFSIILSIILTFFYGKTKNILIPILFCIPLNTLYLNQFTTSIITEASISIQILRIGLWILFAELTLWMWLNSKNN